MKVIAWNWEQRDPPSGRCVHAAPPHGCRQARAVCGCGWRGWWEGCGNDAMARAHREQHAAGCPCWQSAASASGVGA